MTRFPTVQANGVVTHVLVPVDEFRRLMGDTSGVTPPSSEQVAEAVRILEDPHTEWFDANDILWELVRNGLASLRKQHGLTQEELAALLGVSQSHVSRLEKSLDGVTLRTLRRIAEVLAAPPSENQGAA